MIKEKDYLSKMKADSIQFKVFKLLSDKQWHCRECEGKKIASAQYAGGGGIQGLQRGTKSRPGIMIETKRVFCTTCKRDTLSDRWAGEFQQANATTGISKALCKRILEVYGHVDTIEGRKRQSHELIIDHRFPMERWGTTEETNKNDMSEENIRKKFQLLKKDCSGNHNLLKSRACETCIKTDQRGSPFGIKFWYKGNSMWPAEVVKKGSAAEKGCHGCGWYDFEKWRVELNKHLLKN
jgi:hypothetical protein